MHLVSLVYLLCTLLETNDFPCFGHKRDKWTDQPTDRPSYRDKRTHLKTNSVNKLTNSDKKVLMNNCRKWLISYYDTVKLKHYF